MEKSHFISSIGETSIPDFESTLEPSSTHGADLRFHGVVRDREDDRLIRGIDYTAYRPMADQELEAVIEAPARLPPPSTTSSPAFSNALTSPPML